MIQEEVAPKRYNLCSPRWTLYRENKKRFKDWVEVGEGICNAGLEGLKVISCWKDGRRKRVPVSRCSCYKKKIYLFSFIFLFHENYFFGGQLFNCMSNYKLICIEKINGARSPADILEYALRFKKVGDHWTKVM